MGGYERDKDGRMVPVPDDARCEKCLRVRHSVRLRYMLGRYTQALCSECFKAQGGDRAAR